MISVFDLFSIGIGPSSSHTVGPMRAALAFLEKNIKHLHSIQKIQVTLFGSLAFTGKGHGTDRAVLLGLMGEKPETLDPKQVPRMIELIDVEKKLDLLKKFSIPWESSQDIIFDYQTIQPFHPNGLSFDAYHQSGDLIAHSLYFSVGGGFIVDFDEVGHENNNTSTSIAKEKESALPFPFSSAQELLTQCKQKQLSIAELLLANEKTRDSEVSIKNRLLTISEVMIESINNGCNSEGFLEGPLQVRRRAPALYRKLLEKGEPAPGYPDEMNWLNLYAMAVNEENAAGGRVVTAPTNGAAGIIPSVLNYYKNFYHGTEEGIVNFLLTAGAIGILYKRNASISGAEVGCQGEVGVACSMAAAGLAAVLGGNIMQVENAAEIGMEHNLGLTCDPVGGLVQVPCIERNAMGSVKAVNAAQLALAEDGKHKVSLDMVISTMNEIGANMNSIYKETAQGGLAVAVNITEC